VSDIAPRVGVGVVVLRDDMVLLGQRIGSHGAGTWALPGGHLEFGEAVEQCAAREVMEETGLHVQVVARGPYTSNIFPEEGKHYVTLFVVARALTGIPVVREPSRCSAWRWFSWSELPRPLFPPWAAYMPRGSCPGMSPNQSRAALALGSVDLRTLKRALGTVKHVVQLRSAWAGSAANTQSRGKREAGAS
jgi:8-oxo-dGTP diphosphatase